MSNKVDCWVRVTIEFHTDDGPQPSSVTSSSAPCYDGGEEAGFATAVAVAIEEAVIGLPDRRNYCDAEDVFRVLWLRNKPTDTEAGE